MKDLAIQAIAGLTNGITISTPLARAAKLTRRTTFRASRPIP
jgi:hypothetical protein